MGEGCYGRVFFTYVAQHVLKTFGLPSLAVSAVFAIVFGVFLAEVEEELVVGEEGGLRVFDLGGGVSVLGM
jgi:hypothetical protein